MLEVLFLVHSEVCVFSMGPWAWFSVFLALNLVELLIAVSMVMYALQPFRRRRGRCAALTATCPDLCPFFFEAPPREFEFEIFPPKNQGRRKITTVTINELRISRSSDETRRCQKSLVFSMTMSAGMYKELEEAFSDTAALGGPDQSSDVDLTDTMSDLTHWRTKQTVRADPSLQDVQGLTAGTISGSKNWVQIDSSLVDVHCDKSFTAIDATDGLSKQRAPPVSSLEDVHGHAAGRTSSSIDGRTIQTAQAGSSLEDAHRGTVTVTKDIEDEHGDTVGRVIVTMDLEDVHVDPAGPVPLTDDSTGTFNPGVSQADRSPGFLTLPDRQSDTSSEGKSIESEGSSLRDIVTVWTS